MSEIYSPGQNYMEQIPTPLLFNGAMDESCALKVKRAPSFLNIDEGVGHMLKICDRSGSVPIILSMIAAQ